MNSNIFKRRAFLQMAAVSMSGFCRPLNGYAAQNKMPFNRVDSFGVLREPDENGVMLPPGFKSRIVARSGKVPTDSSDYVWHPAPDGGACFETEDGGWLYVSNSEVRSDGGGVGVLSFNSAGEKIDAYSILENTTQNCAGGATPWGTWLSCEEFDRGQVFECDPYGRSPAKARPALGVFKHEAVAVDLRGDTLYLTEDLPDGGFYRFISEKGLPDLAAGSLEIASLVERDGRSYLSWRKIPDPEAVKVPTRNQVDSYASFNGGEGIAFHRGQVFFTTKGDNRVWCYETSSGEIDIIYDMQESETGILSGVDNLTITPSGDVLVAEDGGNMQIVAITPSHQIMPIIQVVGHDRSEICGPAINPSQDRLYFSSQRGETGSNDDGVIFEISRA